MDKAQRVADLLEEYKRKGKDISVESIDPTAEKGKLDELSEDLGRRYGAETKNYKAFLDQYSAKDYPQLKQQLAQESAAVAALPMDQLPTDEGNALVSALFYLQDAPKKLESNKEMVDARLRGRTPEFKAAAELVQQRASSLSENSAKIIQIFDAQKSVKGLPPTIVAYVEQARPHVEAVQKLADDIKTREGKLGELKVDELQQALKVPNPILVLGPTEWRILSEQQVWPVNVDARAMSNTGKIRPRFAGEQQVTTAILSLTSTKKPKVVFMRPGGQPLTSPGFPPFQRGGPFSEIAARMREYNFEVLEKDMSGMSAMQAQMQGQPAPPEASDDEIKDAVWVVLAAPSGQQNPMGGPPPTVAPKLAEHLGHGGSALILPFPQGEDLTSALSSWGIDIHGDMQVVHELIKGAEGSADMIQDAQRDPRIFVLRDYGDAAFTKPLKNLDSIMVPMLPVSTHDAKGVTVKSILPIPTSPAAPMSWGEKETSSLDEGAPPTFNPGKGDLAPPVFGGAAAEKADGGRVVVVGSYLFMLDRWLGFLDPELAKREIIAPRFPGNGELATNALFWLAHMDSMIAISPASTDVPRIRDMSHVALGAWRWGVLLLGIPLCVVASGIGVYFARRD